MEPIAFIPANTYRAEGVRLEDLVLRVVRREPSRRIAGGIAVKTLWLWFKQGKKEYDAAWEVCERTGEDVPLGVFGAFQQA